MKLLQFILILPFIVCCFGSKMDRNLTKATVANDRVDSLYNELVENKIDTILVYRQKYWEEKALVVWRSQNESYGIVFGTKDNYIVKLYEIDKTDPKLEKLMNLYFTHVNEIPDSFSKTNIIASHDSKIEIRSLLKGAIRNHYFMLSEIWPNKETYLGKVSFLIDEIMNK